MDSLTPADTIEEQLDELLDHAQELGLLSEAERDRLTDEIAEGASSCEEALAAWRPKLETETAGAAYQYAVLRFADRNRYGTHGVPATLLFSGGTQVIVQVKDATLARAKKRNRFAKLRLEAGSTTRANLVELLGLVGEYPDELLAYQLHFGVKPCRYPQPEQWALRDAAAAEAEAADGRRDCTDLHAFSVDNASTRDIDDALSIELSADGATATLGIHVADVVRCTRDAREMHTRCSRDTREMHGRCTGDAAAHTGLGLQAVPSAWWEVDALHSGGQLCLQWGATGALHMHMRAHAHAHR